MRLSGVTLSGGVLSRAAQDALARLGFLRAASYPTAYALFVVFSSLDVLFTWAILYRHGRELNAIADWVIRVSQLPGLCAFKFSMVVLVVLICEMVGRRQPETGARLARWAVILSAFPVLVGAVHLAQLGFEPPSVDVMGALDMLREAEASSVAH